MRESVENQTLILKHCSVLSMQATMMDLPTRLRPTGWDRSWNKSRPALLPLNNRRHGKTSVLIHYFYI